MNDISVLNLFLEAGLVVKSVMVILLIASLLTWIVIVERYNFYKKIKNIMSESSIAVFQSGVPFLQKKELKEVIKDVKKYLKEKKPDIKILGVDAVGSVLKKYHETGELDPNEIQPYKIEGLGKNLIPSATDFEVIDYYEKVTDKDAAYKAREIIQKEGIFPGYTCGAILQATIQYAKKGMFDENSFVVLVFPDHGSRYMNKIYSDNWMKEQGFHDPKLPQNKPSTYI